MSEALLKDVFEDLLVRNFATIKGASGLNFSTADLQKAIVDSIGSDDPIEDVSAALGRLTIDKIFKTKNPAEKINFQNVMTMREVFRQYFDIDVPDSESLSRVHRDWQMRHCLVHNDGRIDQRFIHNVDVVGLLGPKDTLNSKVKITKTTFDKTKDDFREMFQLLEALIVGAGLTSKFSPDYQDAAS